MVQCVEDSGPSCAVLFDGREVWSLVRHEIYCATSPDGAWVACVAGHMSALHLHEGRLIEASSGESWDLDVPTGMDGQGHYLELRGPVVWRSSCELEVGFVADEGLAVSASIEIPCQEHH